MPSNTTSLSWCFVAPLHPTLAPKDSKQTSAFILVDNAAATTTSMTSTVIFIVELPSECVIRWLCLQVSDAPFRPCTHPPSTRLPPLPWVWWLIPPWFRRTKPRSQASLGDASRCRLHHQHHHRPAALNDTWYFRVRGGISKYSVSFIFLFCTFETQRHWQVMMLVSFWGLFMCSFSCCFSLV